MNKNEVDEIICSQPLLASRKALSGWLVKEAVSLLPTEVCSLDDDGMETLRQTMTKQLRAKAANNYGSLTLIFIQLILPIVIRLVLAWWKKRHA